MTTPSHGHPPMTIFVTEKPEYVVTKHYWRTPVIAQMCEVWINNDGHIESDCGDEEVWDDDYEYETGFDPVANIKVPEFVAKRPWRDDETTNPDQPPFTLIVRSIDCSIVLDDGTSAPLLYTEAKGLHIGTKPC